MKIDSLGHHKYKSKILLIYLQKLFAEIELKFALNFSLANTFTTFCFDVYVA